MHARPGYFDITLESKVRTEMTVTSRTALYRITFPDTPVTPNTTLSPLMVLELIDLPKTSSNGNITVDGKTGRMSGGAQFSPSFGIGSYTSYFCADYQGADIKDAGTWATQNGQVVLQSVRNGNGTAVTKPEGGWVSFQKPKSNNQLLVRVGMSFISPQQACSNAEKEISDYDFDGTVKAAEKAWRSKLDVISVDAGGASDVLLTAFWSGVYRSMISPQDYTGENPHWSSSEPYYDSYYCIWDSFRSIHPLITLLDPNSQTLMVRSLLDIYRHEGKLPDCRMSFCKGGSAYLNVKRKVADGDHRFYTRRFECGHCHRGRLSKED